MIPNPRLVRVSDEGDGAERIRLEEPCRIVNVPQVHLSSGGQVKVYWQENIGGPILGAPVWVAVLIFTGCLFSLALLELLAGWF